MLIATIGAFSLRAFGPDNNNFMEAVLVMLLFQIGELFEDLAERRSQKAITDAVGLRAPIAHLVKDNECIDIKPEKLEIGDMVLVKVGEIIPADGVIEDGDGYIDMSSLTGEPVPESKIKGDSVSAGTILRKGSISIRVSKDYENSTVSKILRLVEEGSSSKSRGTRFVDKFAKFYTPIVVGLAILVAVVPPLSASWLFPAHAPS
jgi:Cd2+/Zn2+-exporting ATPase